jgi:hydroxyethylthiazole kinase-like uncharacterized protein yjeF
MSRLKAAEVTMSMSEPVAVTPQTLRSWPLPEAGSDKHSRGTVLVFGGSRRTPGAVLLAGEAALRAGGGKLQIATVAGIADPLAVAVPEAGVVGLAETADGHVAATAAKDLLVAAQGTSAVLLGPGLMDVDLAQKLLAEVVPQLEGPVVVDALASAYVTEHPDGLQHLQGQCVLTLNPSELAHTLETDEGEVERDAMAAASSLAGRTGAVVLCGGKDKCVATPDGRGWVVRAGGPGLGVSGSGDVQSGIVTGLIARGAEPAQAAVWGAFLHGMAGERLASRVGPVGFLARELLPEVPRELAELTSA